jgi:hypothetical protein
MIRPPLGLCSRIIRKAPRATRKAPSRFTASTRRHSAKATSPASVAPRLAPALLNTTSSRPNRAPTSAYIASTAASSVTSQGSTSARSPAPASPATASSFAELRATSATRAPAARKASAVARPIPWLAPVTTTTLSSTDIAPPSYRRSGARRRPLPRSRRLRPLPQSSSILPSTTCSMP